MNTPPNDNHPGWAPDGVPPHPWYAGHAAGPGDPAATAGPWAYGPPPWYGYPGPYATPPMPPWAQGAGPDAANVGDAAALEAMLSDMADKNGLGPLKSLLNWQDGDFWKGALVGAAVVLLLNNNELRQTLLKGAAKTAENLGAGTADAATSADAEATDQPTQGAE